MCESEQGGLYNLKTYHCHQYRRTASVCMQVAVDATSGAWVLDSTRGGVGCLHATQWKPESLVPCALRVSHTSGGSTTQCIFNGNTVCWFAACSLNNDSGKHLG